MKAQKMNRRKSNRKRERGSALLVSMMVMVGLSLLGLAFVAITETESTIAVNERNYTQAQSAAETGVNAIVEMFQDSDWAFKRGILPPNINAIKTQRQFASSPPASGYYKPLPTQELFSSPFRGSDDNRFFGDIDTADVLINDAAGAQAKTYLDTLSSTIFYTPNNANEKLRISDIRVYAPPMPGATKNAQGFWVPSGNTVRYGVATVRVTAQKIVNGQVKAERSVKAVIAETPFPTVDGAIETAGSLVGQGNFNVYWGKVLSQQALQLNRPAVGMPWFDAQNFITFERGYDSAPEHADGKPYVVGDIVNPPLTDRGTVPNLVKFSYICTVPGTSAPAASRLTAAQWPTTIGATVAESTGVTWKAIASKPFPIDAGDFYTQYPWLYQMLNKTIEDPWLHARAWQTLVYGNGQGTAPCNDTTNPHPCDYNNATQPVTSRYSNMFQFQNATDTVNAGKPERLPAVFPTMDYEFWKAVAQASDNTPDSGIYYFKYVGNGTTNSFQGPGGATHDVTFWLNNALDATGHTRNGLQAGFYFFDTQNSKNPQFNKGGTLTPDIDINASIGSPFQIKGYVYLNAQHFGSTGQGSLVATDLYAMPGEPFRDVGYRQVDPATKTFTVVGGALPTGTYVTVGASNNVWDFQDVNNNGRFDIYINPTPQAIQRPDGSTDNVYLPVPFYEGCNVTDNAHSAGVTNPCSEPHEPFLNIIYPDPSNPKGPATFGWYDPNITDAQAPTYRKPKTAIGTNSPIVCKHDTSADDCTSNGYDNTGALVSIAPILYGALYNEGGYSGSGNATYYGSLLMRGSFNATGTPDVFFDECLAKGCLETQLKMQKVMVTSKETD
jgi:hypothetical protein